jgi:hypothetical protein
MDEAPVSGSTTLEVELPSGYRIVQSDADQVLIHKNYTFLRDVFDSEEKIVWTFDKVILISSHLKNTISDPSIIICITTGWSREALFQLSHSPVVPSSQWDNVPVGHSLRISFPR